MMPFLDTLQAWVAPAMTDRLVLLLNHVLMREPQAMARLAAHGGKRLRLTVAAWPPALPVPPDLALRVSPAGLFEAEAAAAAPAPELLLKLDAANPLALAWQSLASRQPPVSVEGDAQLAADVDWLLKNLRWDVADDLQRLFGPLVAGQMQQWGQGFGEALKSALQGLSAAAGWPGAQRPR